MIEPTIPPEVPNIEDDYTDLIEWTVEEEEAFLDILNINNPTDE